MIPAPAERAIAWDASRQKPISGGFNLLFLARLAPFLLLFPYNRRESERCLDGVVAPEPCLS